MKIKIHLSEILEKQSMSIAELSRRTGISRRGLYPIYHERSKAIEFGTLAKLCKGLDCSVGDLLEYVSDED